ncbi:unnamed protein product, partial [Hymenolepis diminuta]
MKSNLIERIPSHDFHKILNKKMERRTDFEMEATEPAEVVDVVGDDCEEEDWEGLDGAAEGGEFVTAADV